jgi:YggT family protein
MAIIRTLVILFELLILARVLMSFFPNVDQSNPLIRLVYDVTEPVLRPIRNLLPQTGMFDFSPVIVILILQVLTAFLR